MSTIITYTIKCDDCGKHAPTSDEDTRDAIILSQSQGFHRKKVENGSMWDFCHYCYQDFKAKKKLKNA